MMSHADLPISFWGYALETAAFTLNRVPTKKVQKTPYEIWEEKRSGMLPRASPCGSFERGMRIREKKQGTILANLLLGQQPVDR